MPTSLRLDAGDYYIVDPSYVLGDVLNEMLPQIFKQRNAKVYKRGNKRRLKLRDYTFLIVSDFGGDGMYDGVIHSTRRRKIQVPVDSGMVGVIPVALVKEIGLPRTRYLKPYPKITFDRPASVKIHKSRGNDLPKGATAAFEVSDGENKVEVHFADMNPLGRTRRNPDDLPPEPEGHEITKTTSLVRDHRGWKLVLTCMDEPIVTFNRISVPVTEEAPYLWTAELTDSWDHLSSRYSQSIVGTPAWGQNTINSWSAVISVQTTEENFVLYLSRDGDNRTWQGAIQSNHTYAPQRTFLFRDPSSAYLRA